VRRRLCCSVAFATAPSACSAQPHSNERPRCLACTPPASPPRADRSTRRAAHSQREESVVRARHAFDDRPEDVTRTPKEAARCQQRRARNARSLWCRKIRGAILRKCPAATKQHARRECLVLKPASPRQNATHDSALLLSTRARFLRSIADFDAGATPPLFRLIYFR